jgi:aspartyl-tRNA(Asn)/glutamyl-tRNA(Gln) amidotransferase subunit C
MTITLETVNKIAHLARIKVPEAEKPALVDELNKIMGWIEQLDAVDTSKVEPLANTNDATMTGREDKVTDGKKAPDILLNAPEQMASFFVVPKVIE